jgi:3-phenylpropionate/trans-cinnamate dioxygenase ferredoxin component
VTQKAYVKLASVDQLRESYGTFFQVEGRPVIVTRVEGSIQAFDGTCTHADFQFATSRLIAGCELECPMHGACFDAVTGEVTHGPAERPLERIDLKVENGIVCICVDWANVSETI